MKLVTVSLANRAVKVNREKLESDFQHNILFDGDGADIGHNFRNTTAGWNFPIKAIPAH